jgi:hypothetical protein
MKTFQVNVNTDVQSFMVDIKKFGVSENNDFDKVVMTWLKQLINGKCYTFQKKISKFNSQIKSLIRQHQASCIAQLLAMPLISFGTCNSWTSTNWFDACGKIANEVMSFQKRHDSSINLGDWCMHCGCMCCKFEPSKLIWNST